MAYKKPNKQNMGARPQRNNVNNGNRRPAPHNENAVRQGPRPVNENAVRGNAQKQNREMPRRAPLAADRRAPQANDRRVPPADRRNAATRRTPTNTGAPHANGRPTKRPDRPAAEQNRSRSGANNSQNRRNNRPDGRSRNIHNNGKGGRPTQNSPRKRQSDWVYPEGYTPPANVRSQRHPNNAGRPAQRPPQKKKKEPIIRINWERLFIILGAFFLRFAISFAAVALVMFLIYRNIFFGVPEPVAEEVTYNLCDYNEEGDKTVSVTFVSAGVNAYDKDDLLISFSEISAWLDCAQVGDIYSMRYVLTDENGNTENVVFHNNSHNAFINGTPVVMDCHARFDWGEVWVPLSFVSDYVTGIEITADTETVTLTRSGEDISFVLRPTSPIPNATIEE